MKQKIWVLTEIYYQPMQGQYTEEEVKFLIEKSMNMGMSIRQNQLQGYGGKSGKVQLDEWFEIIKNRKKSGLDIRK